MQLRPCEPEVIFCVDEFGPLNLQPRHGREWAAISGKGKEPPGDLHKQLEPSEISKPFVPYVTFGH